MFVADYINEHRAHPSVITNPRLYGFDSQVDDLTGVDVSEKAMMSWPAVLQAMRLISESIAMFPLTLYRRTGGARPTIEEARDHPVYRIFKDRPNKEQTPFEFKRECVMNAVFRGFGPSQKITDKGGRAREAIPMDPRRLAVKRVSGEIRYTYTEESGNERRLAANEVSLIRGFSDGGLMGYAASEYTKRAIGKSLATDEYGARLFKNGLAVGGIFETDAAFDEQEDRDLLAAAIDKQYRGLGKAHKSMFLDMGIKYRTVGLNAQEAQMLEALTFQVQEVARLFNVPPSLLMDLSHGNLSNMEQMALQFVQVSLGPWITNIEQRWGMDFLSDAERKEYFLRFNVDALLRTDLKSRTEALSTAVGRPWMTPNEAREKLELNPVEDGEELMTPANMLNPGGDPASTTGEAPTPVPAGEEKEPARSEYRNAGREGFLGASEYMELREEPLQDREALKATYAGLIADGGSKIVSAEMREFRKSILRDLLTLDLDDISQMLNAYYKSPDYAKQFDRQLGGIYRNYTEAIAKSVGRELGKNEFLIQHSGYLDDYMQSLVNRTGDAHNNQLFHWIKKLRADGVEDIQSALDKQLNEWHKSWPEKMGRNESVRYGESIVRMGYQQAGISKIVWVNNSGACDLCQELGGKVVGIEGSFLKSGDTVDPKSTTQPLTTVSSILHPPLHRGCGCSLRPR